MKWTIPSPTTCFGIWMISSLCGTVIFIAWHLAARVFRRRGYFYFFYKLLRLMPVFFCFPSVVMLLCLQHFPDQSQLFYLYQTTKPMRTATLILINIWAAGMLCLLGFSLYTCIHVHFLSRGKIPCKRETMQIYKSVCQEVGGKRFPELYQNYKVKVPILTGFFRPKIYLPISEWPKQQLPIIFTHELCHYKQKDIWLKRLTTLLLATQWLNPAVWIFHKTIVLWSEYACDWLSYPQCGGKRQYFQAITSIAEKRGEMRGLGITALFTNKCELEKRVQHVQWCGKKRSGKLWVSALLIFLITSVGTITTYYAATISVKQAYNLYIATEEMLELPPDPKPAECHDSGPSGNIRIKAGTAHEVKNNSFSHRKFDWQLDGHTMYQTSKLELHAETFLTISVDVRPLGKNIKAGFIDMDGNRTYMNSTGCMINIFEIPQDGAYRIFVENMDKHPVKIYGFYMFE